MSSTNTNTVGKEVEELLSAEPNKTSTIQEELNKQLYPEIGMAAQHTSEKVEENEEEGIHPEDNSTEAICMRFLFVVFNDRFVDQELQKHDGEMYTDDAGVTCMKHSFLAIHFSQILKVFAPIARRMASTDCSWSTFPTSKKLSSLPLNVSIIQTIIDFDQLGPHCNFKNNEVQSGAPIQPQGVKYELVVKGKEVHFIPELNESCRTWIVVSSRAITAPSPSPSWTLRFLTTPREVLSPPSKAFSPARCPPWDSYDSFSFRADKT